MSKAGVMMITGASRGIGAVTARMAAKKGYAVCVNYRSEREPAEALVRDIRDAGGRAIAVAGPISCASGSAWRCSTCSSSASAA